VNTERPAASQESLESLRRIVLWCVSFVLVVLFALGGVTFYLRGQEQTRAAEAKRLAVSIQESRIEIIRSSCVEGNRRHDATIRTLEARIREVLKSATPAQRERILASRASTIALINALAPKQDCVALIRDVTRVPVA
jgi:hypothetical protein